MCSLKKEDETEKKLERKEKPLKLRSDVKREKPRVKIQCRDTKTFGEVEKSRHTDAQGGEVLKSWYGLFGSNC